MTKLAKLFSAFLLAFAPGIAAAGSTDLLYPLDPSTAGGGHDFNHSPVGQTFIALATDVEAGIFIADQDSYSDWLRANFNYTGTFPYAIANSITVKLELIEGEGIGGTVLDSQTMTLTKPFIGFVALNFADRGVTLQKRNDYSLVLTDVSGQSYPNGVTGWVVPALQPDTYRDGLPILQGVVKTNTAIGDNAFEVLDVGAVAPAPLTIGGTLPFGQVGELYEATLEVTGGEPPYVWSASALPAGLAFSGGTISGTPEQAGDFPVTVTVMDGLFDTATADYTLTINPAAGSACDNTGGAATAAGKGRVQSVGTTDSVVIGSKRSSVTVDYAACTAVYYGGDATAPAVGDRAEYEGFVKPDGHVMALTLTFN